MVPRATTTRQDVSSQVADNGQVAFTPEIVTRRTTVRAGKRDSVASIANRYKVSAANVAEWNDVKANAAFKAGQQVVMYLPVKLATTSSARPAIKQTSTRGAKAPAAPTRKGETPSRKKR